MGRKPNLEVRERILEKAYDLFHERGFRAVSMDQVASAAGVKKANLFHYYASKDQLGEAVFDLATGIMRQRIEKKFSDACCDPIECVGRMFSDSTKWMKDSDCCRGCFVGNLAQELSDSDERWRERIASFMGFWVEALAGMLQRAKKAGTFRSDFNAKEAAQAIMALFEGAVLISKARRGVGTLEAARKMAVGHLENYRA